MKLFNRKARPQVHRVTVTVPGISGKAIAAEMARTIGDFKAQGSTQCAATTTRGTPCKMTPVTGTGRCVFHQAKP